MRNEEYMNLLNDSIWVAGSLFDRGKTSGSTANISFRCGDDIYISASGTCFGRLREGDFTRTTLDGTILGERKPSKELPLHLAFYNKDSNIKSVIHTHALCSTVLSCLTSLDPDDAIMHHTPYLSMKAGNVALVPYALPGSEELFQMVRERIKKSNALLLANHGPVVGGTSVMEAFYIIEELEESARIQYLLRSESCVSRLL